MKNKKIIVSIIVCLVIVLVSFWGGMKYGQSKNNVPSLSDKQGSFGGPNGFSQNSGTKNQQGMRGGANSGNGVVSGEVLAMDATSMTVKLSNGGSKIVLFSPTTKVEKTVDGAVADVVVGKQVMITGTTNPDGSVSATSVQIRPTLATPAKQ